jgi:ribitol-5-phosphate 2-dehydrogenase (NADP+) / D-ribitol-5-phosphate cytidylyltransferase
LIKIVKISANRLILVMSDYSLLVGKKVVIFGATSGIGEAIQSICEDNGAEIRGYTSKDFNFLEFDYIKKLPNLLEGAEYIINCAGIIDDNTVSYEKIFNINLRPSWEILRYYIENKSLRNVSIVLVGSSAYKSGRKKYILYSATKAALVNMAQGASEALQEQGVRVNVFNPPKTNTAMLRKFSPNEDHSKWADPRKVATAIVDLLLSRETGVISDF